MQLQRQHLCSPLPQGEGLGVRVRRWDMAKSVSERSPDQLFRTLVRIGGNPCKAVRGDMDPGFRPLLSGMNLCQPPRAPTRQGVQRF